MGVSASLEAAAEAPQGARGEPPTPEQMAVARERIERVLAGVQEQMGEAMRVQSQHVVDPLEEAMERAAQKRAQAGTAKASEDVVADLRGAPRPSVVATLEHELSALCAHLGELVANYKIQEAALMRQVEAKAAQVAMAKEMSK
jgi:hypothetical protein